MPVPLLQPFFQGTRQNFRQQTIAWWPTGQLCELQRDTCPSMDGCIQYRLQKLFDQQNPRLSPYTVWLYLRVSGLLFVVNKLVYLHSSQAQHSCIVYIIIYVFIYI